MQVTLADANSCACMLGADRAADLLLGSGHSVISYSELPNSSAFFTDAVGSELGFFKDKSGARPMQDVVIKQGAWTLKLKKIQPANIRALPKEELYLMITILVNWLGSVHGVF